MEPADSDRRCLLHTAAATPPANAPAGGGRSTNNRLRAAPASCGCGRLPPLLALCIACGLATAYYLLRTELWRTVDIGGGGGGGGLYSPAQLAQARRYAERNVLLKYHPGVYAGNDLSYENVLKDPRAKFDWDNDVLVFLHVQKTAGTMFERFLTRHVLTDQPCACAERKRCTCARRAAGGRPHHWLFSRYSTGWACGLHADWTELVRSGCVDATMDRVERSSRKRRYYVSTILREPTARFHSEYRHVTRGAGWPQSVHWCGGRAPSASELPACFDPQRRWRNVTLEEFMRCPWNLAANRMTRMLSDLSLVGCYTADFGALERRGGGERGRVMLASAKANLRSMAFFGLLERVADTQAMFERALGFRFDRTMQGWNSHKRKSDASTLSPSELSAVRRLNHLDVELYDYAAALFDRRMDVLNRERAELDHIGRQQGRRKGSAKEAEGGADDFDGY